MMLRLFVLIMVVACAGCAHQSRITPPPNVVAHQQTLQAIDQWQLIGKLGIRTAHDSGSASLKWSQDQQDYQINLSGPLGQKSMIITGKPGKVSLEEAGQKTLSATSAEALIKKTSGWTLPVAQLAYWVRGVPAPRQKITRLQTNHLGLIDQLEQGGWLISYSNYRHWDVDDKQLTMPQKIVAQYRDVRLILAIRDWQMGATE